MAFEPVKPISSATPSVQAHKRKKVGKDQILIMVGILCTTATIAVLMIIVNRGRVTQPVMPVSVEEGRQGINVKNIDWQKSLFNMKQFRDLKNPLPAPVDIGTVGNPKPFAE